MGFASSSTSYSSNWKTSELNEFHNMTLLSNEILISLHEYYKRFSAWKIDDGVIDYEEFCWVWNKNDNMNWAKRIFNAIDINSDGSLNYREFIKFIAVFINGSFDEQASLSYKIYMNPISKLIEVNDICTLWNETINVDKGRLKEIVSKDEIEYIVHESFKEKKDINLAGYKEIIKEHPDILNLWKINMGIVLKNANLNKQRTIGCFS